MARYDDIFTLFCSRYIPHSKKPSGTVRSRPYAVWSRPDIARSHPYAVQRPSGAVTLVQLLLLCLAHWLSCMLVIVIDMDTVIVVIRFDEKCH